MNNAKIFNLLSDDNFRVKAFAEYCSRAQERYSQWLNEYSKFIESVELPDEAVDPVYVSSLVNQYMLDHHVQDNIIALDSGFIGVRDLLISTASHILSNDLDEPGDTTGGVYSNFDLNLTDATGLVGRTASINLSEIFDSIKAQLHSITCLSAASIAYTEAKGKFADAIQIFNDKIGDIFSDVHADISNSAQYMKNLLKLEDPANFIQAAIAGIGIIAQSEATSDQPVWPLDNDISNYTGASPAGPLNFNAIGDAVVSSAKVAAGVVAGIAKGISSLFGSVFSRSLKYVRETLVNPMDLESLDDLGFGTVDGFQYNLKNYNIYTYNINNIPYPEDELLLKYGNKWFAMKTRFSEWFFNIHEISQPDEYHHSIIGDVVFKPRVINFNKLRPMFPTSGEVTYMDLEESLVNISLLGDDLYDISGLSERDVFKGLVYSSMVENALLDAARFQLINDPSSDSLIDEFSKRAICVDYDSYGDIPINITNLDWIKQFSGYDGADFGERIIFSLIPDGGMYKLNVDAITHSILFVLNFERENPLSESPFIPYSNNHTSMEKPSYRIKTDAENREAFNKFVSSAIIIATVAIVATTSIVAIKRNARSRYFKMAQRTASLDNKMWQGKKLTPSEQRAYIRAYKRMSRSNILSSGLSNHISAVNAANRLSYSENILPYIIGFSKS